MKIKTIYWEKDSCKIIDQTRLPLEFVTLDIASIEQMYEAIKTLRVRGAPAIGIAAAFGIYLGVREKKTSSSSVFVKTVERAGAYIATSRPTAVNLFWAVERISALARSNSALPVDEIKARILAEAVGMIEEDNEICRRIGTFGAAILKHGSTILTHCNAGGLATASYGTALAPVYIAKEQGKSIKVFADETRPLLQGSRLTAWELQKNGVDVTLICDNMAASVMAKGWIDMVIVGTDRVARNGDFANKIGTYGVAVLAKEHNIPFHVAAPFSSIDVKISSGKEIPIEERGADEVTCGFGKQTAPDKVKVYNPAFDVTPVKYVTGFITEKGISPRRKNS